MSEPEEKAWAAIRAEIAETAAERDRLREALELIDAIEIYDVSAAFQMEGIANAALAATAKPKEPADHE